MSFWALGEMVRMRAGIGEGDEEEMTRSRLADTLGQFIPDAEERQRLEGPLLQLLGIGAGKGRERSELFSAWRTFFERLAEANTVVMVFEDLQWADEGLLDFIEEMLAWSRGRSIYVITLSRSELLDRRPTWGAGQRAFTSLGLPPLTDGEMTTLLNGIVPGLPDRAVAEIVARAEGIPLYAVETVRTLLNDGRIEREGDSYRPVGDLSQMAVPETLHALIAARIDHLAPRERTLIQDASVLGLSFSVAALSAVTADPTDVETLLRHLVQRELLSLDDDPRSPERGQFRFVQGLLREVAYGTLSRRDRRARHLAAARYFETLGDDELAGVLAQHYLDAYRAQPDGPEGAAVAAQARIALRAAAQRATNLGSMPQAQRYLEDAMETTTEPSEEQELRMAAGVAAADAGRFEAADAHFIRATELAAAIGDTGARRRAIARRGHVLVEGRQEEAAEIVGAALAEPGLAPDDPGYIELAGRMASLEMRRSHHEEALALADRALPAMERAGREELAVDVMITRGVALANLNRPTEAIVTLTGARALAERREQMGNWLRATVNLGYVLEPEDPVLAFAISREGYERSRRVGIAWAMRYLLSNASDGAMQVGEWDWVLGELHRMLDEDLEWRERMVFGFHELAIRLLRGEAGSADVEEQLSQIAGHASDDAQYRVGPYLLRIYAALAGGQLDEAMRASDGLLSVGFHGAEGGNWGSHAAIWAGDVAAARRYRDAFSAGRSGRRTSAVLVSIDAGIAMLEGHGPVARQRYGEALGRWEELGLPLWRALTQLDIVETGAMESAERHRAAGEARAFFERVGAVPLAARLDTAAQRTSATPSATTARGAAEDPSLTRGR